MDNKRGQEELGGGAGWTGRISQRDVEVLEFVARFGIVPRDAVALWAGTAKTMTARREKRLREAELIEVARPLAIEEPLAGVTAVGLAVCGRGDLRPARLSTATLRHFAAAARLAARWERGGERVLSERELRAAERASGERAYSIRLPSGRHHRPDLILCGDPPIPVEIELSHKSSRRLGWIVSGWAQGVSDGRFARVLYRCDSGALPYVERAVARAGVEAQVDVGLLAPECRPTRPTPE